MTTVGTIAPVRVDLPILQAHPFVFSSPHSGSAYPEGFLEMTALTLAELRSTEDAYVDELFEDVKGLGVPFLGALFPRCFVDPNRQPDELDPKLFADRLSPEIYAATRRVACGLGIVPRIILSGKPIYRHKITLAAAVERIRRYYTPYHTTLRQLIDATRDRFGYCIVIDCHSMPSVGSIVDHDPGKRRADFVLGNCFGRSSPPVLCEQLQRHIQQQGYQVKINVPYAGGYITEHYGQPRQHVYAIQIEVCRSLYMNEHTLEKISNFNAIKKSISHIIQSLIETHAEEDLRQAAE